MYGLAVMLVVSRPKVHLLIPIVVQIYDNLNPAHQRSLLKASFDETCQIVPSAHQICSTFFAMCCYLRAVFVCITKLIVILLGGCGDSLMSSQELSVCSLHNQRTMRTFFSYLTFPLFLQVDAERMDFETPGDADTLELVSPLLI